VVFSASLAVGALFTEGESLIEALFGKPGTLTVWETVFGLAGSIGVAVFILSQRHRLVVALVSRDMARTSGIDVSRLSLFYLVTFSVTVALGLRYLGVLLMGSLIIIPAATAKHLATNLHSMLISAVAIAVFSTLAGTSVAHLIHRETGPVIIAIAAGVFFGGLLKRRGNRRRREPWKGERMRRQPYLVKSLMPHPGERLRRGGEHGVGSPPAAQPPTSYGLRGLTMRTGHRAARSTFSEMLPKRSRPKPPNPRAPTTMRSASAG